MICTEVWKYTKYEPLHETAKIKQFMFMATNQNLQSFTQLCSVASSYTNATEEAAHLPLDNRSKVIIFWLMPPDSSLCYYHRAKNFHPITAFLHLFNITGRSMEERHRQRIRPVNQAVNIQLCFCHFAF